MPKFREITGQFVGYIPDGIDTDIVPDRAPMSGRVTFTPVFTGGVIAFPELIPPEFAHPRTIHARIVDGFVQVEVNEGEGDDEQIVLQPLTLMVTVDDEASQVWSWRAEFDEILIGASDEYVKIPAWSFRVPDGTGPVDLTELVPLKSGGSVDVTKGPRGAGLQNISTQNGQLVFEYTDGEQATIAIPEAVQGPEGPQGPAGADGEPGEKGEKGDPGEVGEVQVGNIVDATPTGKNLMLAATEGAARNTLGLAAGATAANGALSELQDGSSSTPRVWTANNLASYVNSKTENIPTLDVATEDRNGLMASGDVRRLAQVSEGDDKEFRIVDTQGAVAFAVDEAGEVETAGTKYRSSDSPYRVVDSRNRVAFEIDADGRTHIYDLVTSSTGLKELHVFVAAGQSNMKGHAQPYGPDMDPVNPRILQYGVTRRVIEPATTPMDFYPDPVGVSPAWFFAQKYLETQPDHVGVLVIPCAKGGTGFNDGTGTGGTWDDRQVAGEVIDLYGESVTQTLEALAATALPATLKAVLWHQGESDQNYSASYEAQLDRLIANYRSDFGNANLPFVVGQMTQEGFTVHPNKLLIDAIHQDTPRRFRYAGFAPSVKGATNYTDTTHFSREGVKQMGYSMVEAYHRAVANISGFGPQQPQNVTAEFINGTLTIRWEPQMRRVTGYRVEYRIDGGAWIEATRTYPMNLSERVTGLTGSAAEVRVTCINLAQEQAQLYPVIVPHITW